MTNLPKLNNLQIDDLILLALKEDITSEDITTNSILKEDSLGEVKLLSKEEGIIAGLDVFKRTFLLLDNEIDIEFFVEDGDSIEKGQTLAIVKGKVRTLLSGERVALNYLQRMSGIATYTKKMVEKLNDKKTVLVDTRKTTPNMRVFEKYSVLVGGGKNHRYNLSDGILLKDNHIDAAGSVKKAIEMAKEYAPFVRKIEVEVENMDMLYEALESKADIIMLDNMSVEEISQAIEIINGRAETEASGNIDINNIDNYRNLGLDYISSGSLTHSAKILDLSMKNLKII